MSIRSAASLIDALRECPLLGSAQLDEVNRTLQERFPDADALAGELVQRGWLTTFQAGRLVERRGADLLLGPYILLEALGEGGMGQVFKARHQIMDRLVAIKIIRKERLAHPAAVQRFQREIRLAAQLDHPHLIRAFDAFHIGDVHFLVMEYAEGIDLQRLIEKSGPLPVAQACIWIRQAALGLQYLHECGMLHRDIKPSNLQVTARGMVVKILDLGLARSQATDAEARGVTNLTQDRTVLGTADYIAPEQIADPRGVDIRADLYSLGCTLYFLLSGRPPFPGVPWEEKLVCHRKAVAQPIEQVRPDVPCTLATTLRRLMAKRPDDRYPTPAALADALSAFCPPAGPVPATVSAIVRPESGDAGCPSLVDSPGRYERGWTLEVDSSGSSAQRSNGAVEPPVSVAARTVPQAAGRRRLVLGGIAVLVLSILLLLLLWPKDRPEQQQRDAVSGRNSVVGPESKRPAIRLGQARLNEDSTDMVVGDLGEPLLGSPRLGKNDPVEILGESEDKYQIRWPYRSPTAPGEHVGWVSKQFIIPNAD